MKGFANECNSHGIMLAGEFQGKIFLKTTDKKKKTGGGRKRSVGDRVGDFKEAEKAKNDICMLKVIKRDMQRNRLSWRQRFKHKRLTSSDIDKVRHI